MCQQLYLITRRCDKIMTKDEQGYNGWTNRETWAVALHASNTEDWQNHTLQLVHNTTNHGDENKYLTKEQLHLRHLENALADWVEDILVTVFHCPDNATKDMRMMAADIGSHWRINYHEWAINLLSDYNEI